MKRVLPVAFAGVTLMAVLMYGAGRQGAAAVNGTLEGTLVDSKTGEFIAEGQIRLTGGPIDAAAFDRLKTALAARQVEIPPPGKLSVEEFIENVNDIAAARGMALNNPQLQSAITAFRSSNDTRFRAQSDGEGRFVIRNLPPGRYTVSAQREGYFGASVNSGVTAPATATVSVAAGETAALTLPMIPGATISGRVTSNGQPQASLTVQAFAITYQNGYQVLQPVTSRATDDRGQYRLYYLPPGEYLVAATPRTTVRPTLANVTTPSTAGPTPSPEPFPAEQPARTFYPGTMDRGAAGIVSVRDGREVVDVDIPMRASALYKVSGEVRVAVPTSVMNSNSRQGTTVRAEVAFALHDPNVPDDMGGFTIGTVALQPNGDLFVGKFQATGVPPGFYDWRSAVYETSTDGSLQPTTTIVPVEVRGADVEGLHFDIYQTVRVDGKVTVDDGPPGANKVRVWLQVEGASAKRPGYQAIAARVVLADEKTGAFSIGGVQMGRFHLMIGDTLSPKLYIEDVRSGGESVFDPGFNVGAAAPAALAVLLRSGAGTVAGTVMLDEKNPAAAAVVALVPAVPYRQNRARFHTATTDAKGKFSMGSVAPGEYKLFAWSDAPGGAYFNAAFLERFEEKGVAVAITGQASTVTMQLSPIAPDPH